MSLLEARLRWIKYVVLGLVLSVMIALPGLAKSTGYTPWSVERELALDLGPSQAVPTAEAPELDDRTEFASFIDHVLAEELAAKSTPGAAIAVVKDGEIFFAKGYGYADLEQQVPVDAEATRFRVASLSKLFTATATMQLYEQGLLSLEDAVDDYSGDRVQLQNPFDEPVTFAQLLTHTDGSTKRRIGLAADTEAKQPSLEDYLADHLPPIVYPPGKLFSYSSHSIAFLGYLVQRIADQPFVDYIDEHILQPLQMNRSSFAQPPPHREALATGYRKVGNQFQAVPYLYLNIGPGAALSSTATDMAHFMIAHLQEGQYENRRILEPESVAEMHQIHFRSHPRLPGTGYGFRERYINGLSVIGHLGSLRGYSSSLTLIPEKNIGIFIASNSFAGIHSRVLRQFFDRYFPPSENISAVTDAELMDPSQLDLDRFVGTYRDLEYPRHTIAKLTAPYEHITIQRTDTGLEIQTPSLFFRKQRPNSQLQPIDLLLFRQPEGETLTAFEADNEGNIRYAYNPVFSKMATFTKIAWHENLWFHAAFIGVAIVLFCISLWIWPLHPTLRRLRGKPFEVLAPTPLAWQIAGWASLLNLVFLGGFPLALWLYGGWKLAYGMPWFGYIFLALPLISAVLTVAVVAIALWSYRQKEWSTVRRAYYSLLAIAAAGFMVLLNYWNVLGFQF